MGRKRMNKPIVKKKLKKSDEYYFPIIAKNVKKYRLEQNISQETLAEIVNISRSYLSDIETFKRDKRVTIPILTRISEALDKDLKDFFE